MSKEELREENDFEFSDDARFRLTPEYILYSLLSDDYRLDVGPWKSKIWGHIFEDFMILLEQSGYVSKTSGGDNDE